MQDVPQNARGKLRALIKDTSAYASKRPNPQAQPPSVMLLPLLAGFVITAIIVYFLLS